MRAGSIGFVLLGISTPNVRRVPSASDSIDIRPRISTGASWITTRKSGQDRTRRPPIVVSAKPCGMRAEAVTRWPCPGIQLVGVENAISNVAHRLPQPLDAVACAPSQVSSAKPSTSILCPSPSDEMKMFRLTLCRPNFVRPRTRDTGFSSKTCPIDHIALTSRLNVVSGSPCSRHVSEANPRVHFSILTATQVSASHPKDRKKTDRKPGRGRSAPARS
jgi:hypothetical protein